MDRFTTVWFDTLEETAWNCAAPPEGEVSMSIAGSKVASGSLDCLPHNRLHGLQVCAVASIEIPPCPCNVFLLPLLIVQGPVPGIPSGGLHVMAQIAEEEGGSSSQDKQKQSGG